jgi:hypothetical protein
MFIENKYTRWYYKIIDKSKIKNDKSLVYFEKHHIIPKSLGGNNYKDNIVILTYREHFLCHWLLIKMTAGQDKMKMLFALHKMTSPDMYGNRIISSWQYALAKKYNSKDNNEFKTRSVNKGKITVKDKDGKVFHVTKDDPRWINGNVTHVTKGIKRIYSKEEKIERYKKIKGRKYTPEEYKRRELTCWKGWSKGIKKGKQSAETIEKRKIAMTGNPKPKVECPHCSKIGGISAMKRWHFDNCKLRELNCEFV